MKRVISSFLILMLSVGLIAPAGAAELIATTRTDAAGLPRLAEQYAVKPLTLADCYAFALRQSEVIAINVEAIKIAEARFLQALSIMLPHVSYISVDKQESIPNDAGTTFATLKPTKSSERNFQLTQNLFTGFKAIAAIKGSKFERLQRMDEKARAEQLLLVDVANAFYLLMEKREDIKALRNIKATLIDRIHELRQREQLGRSRPSEVVNAKAQLYGIEASLQLVRNQEIIARQLLEFLVGQQIREITDSYELTASLKDESYYVGKAPLRPDVQAAHYAWQVAKKEREMIDSEFLPTVNMIGNYYTQRTGFNKGTDWDVMIKANVPIFQGTETLGKSKEASSKAQQRKLEYDRLMRKTPYEIKDAFVSLKTARAVSSALKKEYSAAKLNYHLQRTDYQRSLVNNLDVLAAIQTLRDAQRDFIHALYESKRLYWQLRVAIGDDAAVSLYDTF